MAASHLKELIRQKDGIEEDIKMMYEVLRTQGDVGMDKPLVDQEGFPRADIDLVQVRTARNKIACLQNDHKSLMARIEKGLIEYHAICAEERAGSTSEQMQHSFPDIPRDNLEPFAAINLVSSGSPADQVGLKVGDSILQFGSLTKRNFTSLSDVARIVQHCKGKTVPVTVKRDALEVTFPLVPNEWEGRGLLGCNIVPM